MKLELSQHFRRNLKYQVSWKSVQWEHRWSLRSDRRADKYDEANSRFSH